MTLYITANVLSNAFFYVNKPFNTHQRLKIDAGWGKFEKQLENQLIYLVIYKISFWFITEKI